MDAHPVEELKHDWSAKVALALLAILTVWWIVLQVVNGAGESGSRELLWAACYQSLALWGGIWGIIIARAWGGTKSVMGRAILAFALGLLFENIGQTVFSYYNLFLNVEVPYPSLADIGFFGSIPFYIYGAAMIGKASGVTISLRSFGNKLQAAIVPLVMLGLSYFFFLSTYEFDWSDPLRVFLDFGYPLGQATYVSFALLVYLLTKKTLGGVMKNRVLFILIALIVQYCADYNFLSQAYAGSWRNGGYGDAIYMLAYFVMAVGLIRLKPEFIKPRSR